MKYLPHLIPKHRKVLPEYFRGSIYGIHPKGKAAPFLLYVAAIFFFLFALINILHPPLLILLGTIGFILLPRGHQWLERTLQFHLTPRIKSLFIGILIVLSLPLTHYYTAIDKQEAAQAKLRADEAAAVQAIANQKEQQKRDSFNYYLQAALALENDSKNEASSSALYNATRFAAGAAEQALISDARIRIASVKALTLVRQGKYQAAIPELSTLLVNDPGNKDLLYNRAVCYSKTGKTGEAVEDLKPLLREGNEKADKLHETINPVRKRIIGYITLCCDGSTSSATGRGACSHHGGVCDWEHPVYEESRKYE